MTSAEGHISIVLATLLTAIGQINIKKAAVHHVSFLRKFLHRSFLTGCMALIAAPVLCSLAAKVVDFSIMYAMTSLNFVFILFFSPLFLKEKFDRPKIIGVTFIVAGLLIMVSA